MIVNKQKVLGQFFTPLELAEDIVHSAKMYFPNNPMVLEPAYGEGVFFEALQNENVNCSSFLGIEIDSTLNNHNSHNILNADFTQLSPLNQFDVIITNPPYTRHHLIDKDEKHALFKRIEKETQIKLSGLAGLHCYFLLLADKWLKDDGIGVWLLPAEFLDVNYGEQVKKYLISNVQLVRVHLYDTNESSLFSTATVSSCVIVYQKTKRKDKQYDVLFTFGSSMRNPKMVNSISKEKLQASNRWSSLFHERHITIQNTDSSIISDFFEVKRGIATGYNSFFILSKREIEEKGLPIECFTPIVENSKSIKTSIIEYDEIGNPLSLDKYVLNTDLSLEIIIKQYPNLYRYLQTGIEMGALNRYILKNRKIWYKQEERKPAPFLCSYISRDNNTSGIKFIWNKGTAIATNNFLMLYPKDRLQRAIKESRVTYEELFEKLSNIDAITLYTQSRCYATGLKKFEPSELGNVKLDLAI